MQSKATTAQTSESRAESRLSIGIFAWNEELVIRKTLASLFEQSLFAELARLGQRCEIICVLNGCTDRTAEVVENVFDQQRSFHPHREVFSCRIANLRERGKINAWNQFVHSLSARSAQCLLMMDADIVLHRREALRKLVRTLEQDSEASVAVGRPRKDIEFKSRKSPRERVSLAISQLTESAAGQLCAQLYGIRSRVARNIWLPKDLAACEDGFIKALVCTDFLAHPVLCRRIRRAEGADHTFEAYTSPVAVFKNQKRQVIGQTIVHILIDQFLPSLVASDPGRLPELLKGKEKEEPLWLKRLIQAHLERTKFCWRLYPGLLTERFKHVMRLGPLKRIAFLPLALGSAMVTFFASVAARRALSAGGTDYWPKAPRFGRDAIGAKLSAGHTRRIESPESVV